MERKKVAKGYKDRVVYSGDVVNVYRNLHKDALSIRIKQLVYGHSTMIIMKDASFHVGQSGNEKVNREKRKGVHAYIKGEIIDAVEFEIQEVDLLYLILDGSRYERVFYNPYRVKQFTNEKTLEPIYNAENVVVILDRVYVK